VPVKPLWTRPSLRNVIKDRAKRAVVAVGCGMNRIIGCRTPNSLGILMYHRVVDAIPGIDPPTWNISPAGFREQLSGLLDQGFRPWSLRRVIEYHELGKKLPPKSFVVTFDDGHENVYTNAWPVLQSLKVPATIFLATAFIDSQKPFPFDDWVAAGSSLVPIESWRPLSSAQCREMAADGLIDLGAHTHTHQDFSDRSLEFRIDLTTNVNVLKSSYKTTKPGFAFPYGRVNPALMDAAQDCSVTCALTTLGIPVNTLDHPFGWGRFDVEAWDTSRTLAAKLGGWYSWAPRLQRHVSSLRRRFKFGGN
jgi:peptidoglycan/xylan/chitin deacetylase (PgdA/CDA1 family)